VSSGETVVWNRHFSLRTPWTGLLLAGCLDTSGCRHNTVPRVTRPGIRPESPLFRTSAPGARHLSTRVCRVPAIPMPALHRVYGVPARFTIFRKGVVLD
jgi:hypothetical protein